MNTDYTGFISIILVAAVFVFFIIWIGNKISKKYSKQIDKVKVSLKEEAHLTIEQSKNLKSSKTLKRLTNIVIFFFILTLLSLFVIPSIYISLSFFTIGLISFFIKKIIFNKEDKKIKECMKKEKIITEK